MKSPGQINFHLNGNNETVAEVVISGVHLIVRPDMRGNDEKVLTGWKVGLFGDIDGKMDSSNKLNEAFVPGGPDDQEEILDTYARRLASGFQPNDVFKDLDEKDSLDLAKYAEDLQAGKLK